MKKTAEEILEKYDEYFLCPSEYHEEVLGEKALEAMKEYADQFRQPDVSGELPLEQYPDNEADGIVFCGKCGKQK